MTHGCSAAGMTHGYFAAGMTHGSSAAGMTHGYFAAGMTHGHFAADMMHGHFAADMMHGHFAADMMNGHFAADLDSPDCRSVASVRSASVAQEKQPTSRASMFGGEPPRMPFCLDNVAVRLRLRMQLSQHTAPVQTVALNARSLGKESPRKCICKNADNS